MTVDLETLTSPAELRSLLEVGALERWRVETAALLGLQTAIAALGEPAESGMGPLIHALTLPDEGSGEQRMSRFRARHAARAGLEQAWISLSRTPPECSRRVAYVATKAAATSMHRHPPQCDELLAACRAAIVDFERSDKDALEELTPAGIVACGTYPDFVGALRGLSYAVREQEPEELARCVLAVLKRCSLAAPVLEIETAIPPALIPWLLGVGDPLED